MVMWLQEYTPLAMKRETGKFHKALGKWVRILQQYALDYIDDKVSLPKLFKLSQKAAGSTDRRCIRKLQYCVRLCIYL